MFELTRDEYDSLRSQFGTLKQEANSKKSRISLEEMRQQAQNPQKKISQSEEESLLIDFAGQEDLYGFPKHLAFPLQVSNPHFYILNHLFTFFRIRFACQIQMVI